MNNMAAVGLQVLKNQLSRSRKVISKGYCGAECGIDWLNNFCGDFYEFASGLHKFIASEVEEELDDNENLDTVFLCLAQVCLCTKYLERVIRAEETAGRAITSSRRHFVDRILWCMDRLEIAAGNMSVLGHDKTSEQAMSGYGFMVLLEIAKDLVAGFNTYKENPDIDIEYAIESSNEIHRAVRFMVGHALALANVALFEDKTALSALCQKVLRDSKAFVEECSMNFQLAQTNEWNRRLKAIALGDSLNQLHQYVDDTILRLIFICFTDLEKFSLDKLRAKMRQCGSDDAELDEFIADFDVNLDRLAQIGLFAANESHCPKLKTLVLSCMASLEALDSCIIPSLQTRNGADMHSEIMEQHFYEEITKLKSVICEIVDIKPISRCFHEMLNNCIIQTEKEFNKSKLDDMVQMGEFLLQYFQHPTNKKDLQQTNCKRLEYFQKLTLMLHECRAIMVCANQVENSRILKRFKILRAVMRKFVDAIDKTQQELSKKLETNIILPTLPIAETHTLDLYESQLLLQAIEPSVCSILYRNESEIFTPRRRAVSESMRCNYSKCPLTALQVTQAVAKGDLHSKSGIDWQQIRQSRCGSSVRRKESLRTVMFKRQKVRDFYLQNSASLQITEILDQLTQISENGLSSENEQLLNTSRIE
ncbi:serendipity locus protein alpha-like isoform X2 [Rhagoletis pomonella]|uniref:serendipity locus protein alpha-like isoform X2 n=1 Tax=Rhagoletis pomonella TaxID=28610 RepID=UPI0017850B2A|nr:serendipity locus protein alpha-like isoform X2 [Rhagoletis pomonella]